MTLSVHPSMSNVLNDKGDEQAGNHDCSCSSFILDTLNAVVREEELCVREKLNYVSRPYETQVKGNVHAQ
jgi:hypothetical protein